MNYQSIKLVSITSSLIFSNHSFAYSLEKSNTDMLVTTRYEQNIHANDKSSNVKLGGVLQWDHEVDKSALFNDKSNTDLRRSYLYMIGHENNWGYKATLRFGEDGATNGDAVELFIRYTGINELVNITVGKQKIPFGLELLTSSKNISLLERSAITDYYTNGPSLGIQVHGIGNNWSYGLGLFESNNKSSASLSHTGFTGRITKAMTLTNQLLVHLGSGFTSRNSYINKKSFTNYNVEKVSKEILSELTPVNSDINSNT